MCCHFSLVAFDVLSLSLVLVSLTAVQLVLLLGSVLPGLSALPGLGRLPY